MILFDYIVNLSIFSLMVSTPLVVCSFIYHKPFRRHRYWVSIYAGVVSIILVLLSIHDHGYSYDIRYAPVILVFAYLGPIAGIITGVFALISRLYLSGNWYPAIIGWTIIMVGFTILSSYIKHLNPVKRLVSLYIAYFTIYVVTVPIIFNVFRDRPFFHLQYLLFVMLGVIIGGLLIESYVKLYRIISERKKMEQVLAASESNYRLIAENTSDLIMVMNIEQKISYFSPSHKAVLGYDSTELVVIELCKLIHPEDVCMFRNTIGKMFDNQESYSMEYRFQHKDGRWIDFESRCMPVKGESNLIEHIVIISRDISERKKAEEILLQSEKLSIVGELAAGVAHEIRNPLTTIKGFVQLYKKENSSIEYNDLLLSELERIETITSELLSLGKTQAVQLKQTNLRELIENMVELLSPQAHMHNIDITFNYDEYPFFITCERNQLKQVFLNILKNAIESMQEGGKIQLNLQKGLKGECKIFVLV